MFSKIRTPDIESNLVLYSSGLQTFAVVHRVQLEKMRLKHRILQIIIVIELSPSTFYVFLHEQQFLHPCQLFGISWIRERTSKIIDRQARFP